MGRDAIAITSVGGRILEWSVILPGSSHAPLRTAAMAMPALPKARPHNSKGNRRPDDWPGILYPKHPFRFPVSLCLSANGRDVIASLPSPSRL